MRISVRALTSAALALLFAPPLVAAIQARAELMVPRAMAGFLAFGAARLLVEGMTWGTQTLARRQTQSFKTNGP